MPRVPASIARPYAFSRPATKPIGDTAQTVRAVPAAPMVSATPPPSELPATCGR